MSNILNTNISIEDILSLVSKKQEIKSMELNAFINLFLKITEPIARPDSIIYYKENLKLTCNFFIANGVYETKDINQAVIDKFIRFSLSRKNKPATINKRMNILQTAFKRLNDLNLIDIPFYKYTKLKETPTKIEVIKMEDLKTILDQIEQMKLTHQLMIYLLIGTGIRRNELVHIKVENINFKNKTIYLDFTKTGKPRYCYFNEKIEELILKQIEQNHSIKNPYLFAKGDSHIDKQSVSSMLFKLKRDLNIDVLSSHKFRHLYATQLLKNGADIFTVKELLGHANIKMTQRYIDFDNEEIKKNNFKYNPLTNL